MFIVIIGTKASGKEEVAKYLQILGFSRIRLNTQLDSLENSNGDSAETLVFGSAKDIVKHVTPRWTQNYVTTDVTSIIDLHLLRKRPFVLIVGIDAPVVLRYRRYCARNGTHDPKLTLEQFAATDDMLLYACEEPPTSSDEDLDVLTTDSESSITDSKLVSAGEPAVLKPLVQSPIIRNTIDATELSMRRALAGAHVSIANLFPSIGALHMHLGQLDLLNGERIRPSWDTYFMLLSELASHRSNCMKRKVGCILVKDTQIIATGYNGTPKGITNCNEGGCPRCNAGTPCGISLDHCLCIHAEENALLEAGRGRVRNAEGVALYCNTCPCLGCAKKIVQLGVKTVVYSKGYGMDDLTLKLFKEANIVVRQHTPPVISM
ncbi:Deoxycytidine monophosphate (dCMP) deaminase [Coemansia sp. RSA 1813]|nr:Deoxycytidine monophosphate (dCMP) deaminase [Coemansia sp. RSA 1843]KAJ2092401.1 Deoxycytidine monophosphate (dCMP) deaminase [Coemansia sp. RSA 986]KAJ2217374.1 Deoxycytidine monophosphate (dCMP) deaminase [Coemansia sp. RSA 487]KAJ2572599.1 Deoxycytidine monophosphate (dCMP) deaminase [Coemansia sp. RSA 1813]